MNLARGVTVDDYTVYIGGHVCNVTVLRSDFLQCSPDKPPHVDGKGPKQAVVVSRKHCSYGSFCILNTISLSDISCLLLFQYAYKINKIIWYLV